MIHLVEVTPENWRKIIALGVSKKQEKFVAPSIAILARAYAYRNEGGNVLIIYNEDEMVGLAFYREWNDLYILEQFMIDWKFQGKGYSKVALQLILSRMKEEGKYNRVELCYCRGNDIASKLFASLGFYHTSSEDEDDDEIIMALDL